MAIRVAWQLHTVGLVVAYTGLFGCQAPPSHQTDEVLSVRSQALQATDPSTGDISVGVGNIGQGVQILPSNSVRITPSAAELARLNSLKAALPQTAANGTPQLTPTQETMQWIAGKDPNAIINFTLLLPERAFNWDQFRGVTDATRASLVQTRRSDLAPGQQTVIAKLNALGGTNIVQRWLSNAVDVQLPASFASTLASWPEVSEVEHDETVNILGTPGDGASGGDRRIETHADRLIANRFQGWEGNLNCPTCPVRLGDVGWYVDRAGNQNRVPSYHPGFKDVVSGSTRYYHNLLCNPTVSSCASDWDPSVQTHDTVVMGVMAGSIEGGQDANFPGFFTSAQTDRSGISAQASIEYLRAGDATSLAIAIALEFAVEMGVNIVNNSWGLAWNSTPGTDLSSLNETIRNAFNAGTTIVFAAGDSNVSTTSFSTTCNQGYPSNRPEVIAVNGLNTTYTSSGTLPANPILGPGAWSTSGCTIDVFNGSSYVPQPDNSIAVVAPGFVGLTYQDVGGVYGYGGLWIGSSFAAPIVAGAAGLLSDAWEELGYGIRPDYWLKTDLVMLSDGYEFGSYTDGGTNRLVGGTSQFSGAGRIKMRTPVDDFPSGSWGWWNSSYNLYNGNAVQRSVPANVQNYRLAMFWDESDLTHAADIDVWVDAYDGNGNLCASYVAGQSDYSILNSIHIKRSDIPACALPNGTLRATIHAYAIPSGQNRVVYVGELFDNEATY